MLGNIKTFTNLISFFLKSSAYQNILDEKNYKNERSLENNSHFEDSNMAQCY